MTKESLITSAYRMIETPEEGVWEVVLVNNKIDRYNTKVNPSGLVSSPSTASIFYVHKGEKTVNTGAGLNHVRTIENYKTQDIVNGKPYIIPLALVGEVKVTKHNRLWYMHQGQRTDGGSFLEALMSKSTNKVSVGFHGVKGRVTENGKETIYNLRSAPRLKEFEAKQREGLESEYVEWELIELSFLDVNSGQGDSIATQIRELNQLNQSTTMSKYQPNQTLVKEVKLKVLELKDPENNIYSVEIDGETRDMPESELDTFTVEVEVPKETEPREIVKEESTESVEKSGETDANAEPKEGKDMMQEMSAKIDELFELIDALQKQKQKDDNLNEAKTPKEDESQPMESSQRALMDIIAKNPCLVSDIQDKNLSEKIQRSLNFTNSPVKVSEVQARDGVGAEENKTESKLIKQSNHNPYNRK